MATVVLPSATVCSGALALIQPRVRLLVSTFSPPSVKPSGTEAFALAAAARALACAACIAATLCAAVPRLAIERCNSALACCCCADGFVSADTGMPLGSRPVDCAALCVAPFAANHAPLKAR